MVVAMSQKTQTRQRKYVISEERGLSPDLQTVFHYRLPQRGVQLRVFSDLGPSMTTSLKQMDEVLLACLIRIENLKDDQGAPLEWVPDSYKVNAGILGAIPPIVRMEVGDHIVGEMTSGPVQAKQEGDAPGK